MLPATQVTAQFSFAASCTHEERMSSMLFKSTLR